MIAGVPESFVALAPLVLMAFYFIGTSLTVANYVGYVRFNEDVYGTAFKRGYLVFTVLGMIAYYLICGPAWLWAAKYSTVYKDRVHRTAIGMFAIFLLHDMPLFVMEWHAILCCGWRNDLQGFVFIIQFMEWIISFCFGWLGYAYVMSGFLQRACGASFGVNGEIASSSGLKTGTELIHILPPLSAASTPMLLHSGGGRRSEPAAVPFPGVQDMPPGSAGSGGRAGLSGSSRFGTGSTRAGGGQGSGGTFSPREGGRRAVPLREALSDGRQFDPDDEGESSGDGEGGARRGPSEGTMRFGGSNREPRTFTFGSCFADDDGPGSGAHAAPVAHHSVPMRDAGGYRNPEVVTYDRDREGSPSSQFSPVHPAYDGRRSAGSRPGASVYIERTLI